MSRLNREQERISDVVEDALLFACDTEQFAINLRNFSDALLKASRDKQRSLSVKGRKAGFTHTRPELLEEVG
jgi:hypothetical protein